MKIENFRSQIIVAGRVFWSKFKPFLFCMAIVILFGQIFGNDNVYIGISLATALLTYRYIDIGISPKSASVCLFCLFLLTGFASWANQLGVWISIPVNFLTVYTLMMCTTMPLIQKAYIPIVLCFIFVQGNPVTGEAAVRRMAAFLFAGILVGACYYLFHHDHPQKRTMKDVFREAFHFSTRTQFALRMAIGLTLAMLVGGVFPSERPMWIGIVTYAVTQPFFTDTWKRVTHRAAGCAAGAVCFWVLFRYVIDPRYSAVVMLVCGFLSSVPSQYSIQQIFVTINALGAAMILLDPSQSISLRILFLGLGVAIALFCCMLMDKVIIPIHSRYSSTSQADSGQTSARQMKGR